MSQGTQTDAQDVGTQTEEGDTSTKKQQRLRLARRAPESMPCPVLSPFTLHDAFSGSIISSEAFAAANETHPAKVFVRDATISTNEKRDSMPADQTLHMWEEKSPFEDADPRVHLRVPYLGKALTKRVTDDEAEGDATEELELGYSYQLTGTAALQKKFKKALTAANTKDQIEAVADKAATKLVEGNVGKKDKVQSICLCMRLDDSIVSHGAMYFTTAKTPPPDFSVCKSNDCNGAFAKTAAA